MNCQQLRSVRETVRLGFNPTEVAPALRSSQPGVSRQIRELGDEPGTAIFVCAGKRLTGLTPLGATVLPIVERLLHEAANLQRAGAEWRGRLSADHLLSRLHRPLAHRRGLRARRAGARDRAGGDGRRRDQDLCRAGHGPGHRRGDRLRRRARPAPAPIDARHRFAANRSRLAILRGRWQRDHVCEFITGFAPPLTRDRVLRALQAEPGDDFEL